MQQKNEALTALRKSTRHRGKDKCENSGSTFKKRVR
jgi:hypothetical protein